MIKHSSQEMQHKKHARRIKAQHSDKTSNMHKRHFQSLQVDVKHITTGAGILQQKYIKHSMF